MSEALVAPKDRAEIMDALKRATKAYFNSDHSGELAMAAALVEFHERMEFYGRRKANDFMGNDHEQMARMVADAVAESPPA